VIPLYQMKIKKQDHKIIEEKEVEWEVGKEDEELNMHIYLKMKVKKKIHTINKKVMCRI
jgi:hypothetical protein